MGPRGWASAGALLIRTSRWPRLLSYGRRRPNQGGHEPPPLTAVQRDRGQRREDRRGRGRARGQTASLRAATRDPRNDPQARPTRRFARGRGEEGAGDSRAAARGRDQGLGLARCDVPRSAARGRAGAARPAGRAASRVGSRTPARGATSESRDAGLGHPTGRSRTRTTGAASSLPAGRNAHGVSSRSVAGRQAGGGSGLRGHVRRDHADRQGTVVAWQPTPTYASAPLWPPGCQSVRGPYVAMAHRRARRPQCSKTSKSYVAVRGRRASPGLPAARELSVHPWLGPRGDRSCSPWLTAVGEG
jgi:hypothetical protein